MDSTPTPFEAVAPHLGTDQAFLRAMQNQELQSAIHALAEEEHPQLFPLLLDRFSSNDVWVKLYALELVGFHYQFACEHPFIDDLFQLVGSVHSAALDDVGLPSTAAGVLSVQLKEVSDEMVGLLDQIRLPDLKVQYLRALLQIHGLNFHSAQRLSAHYEGQGDTITSDTFYLLLAD